MTSTSSLEFPSRRDVRIVGLLCGVAAIEVAGAVLVGAAAPDPRALGIVVALLLLLSAGLIVMVRRLDRVPGGGRRPEDPVRSVPMAGRNLRDRSGLLSQKRGGGPRSIDRPSGDRVLPPGQDSRALSGPAGRVR